MLGNVTLTYHAMIENKKECEIMSHSFYSIIKNQNKLEWYIKKDTTINYVTYLMH